MRDLYVTSWPRPKLARIAAAGATVAVRHLSSDATRARENLKLSVRAWRVCTKAVVTEGMRPAGPQNHPTMLESFDLKGPHWVRRRSRGKAMRQNFLSVN